MTGYYILYAIFAVNNCFYDMKTLGDRIQDLRKKKGWSQTELANQLGISLIQTQRYETKGVQPPADVLKNMSDVLNTSIDYLVKGDKDQRAKESLKDTELLAFFKAVEQMNAKDQNVVKTLIDAFITKKKVQQLAQ